MGFFLAAGTSFDYYLEHQKKEKIAAINQQFSVTNLKSVHGKQ